MTRRVLIATIVTLAVPGLAVLLLAVALVMPSATIAYRAWRRGKI